MADLIHNTLIISTRSENEMKHFLKQTDYDKNNFSYSGTIPIPNKISKCGNTETIEQWKMNNWGVDLDAAKPNTQLISKTIIKITFQSLYGPPIKWLIETSSVYTGIKFKLTSDIEGAVARSEYIVGNGTVFYRVEPQNQ